MGMSSINGKLEKSLVEKASNTLKGGCEIVSNFLSKSITKIRKSVSARTLAVLTAAMSIPSVSCGDVAMDSSTQSAISDDTNNSEQKEHLTDGLVSLGVSAPEKADTAIKPKWSFNGRYSKDDFKFSLYTDGNKESFYESPVVSKGEFEYKGNVNDSNLASLKVRAFKVDEKGQTGEEIKFCQENESNCDGMLGSDTVVLMDRKAN